MAQRQPRQIDLDYLRWLREQRCACGCRRGPPCDAAHLRASSSVYGKSNAMGMKPDDRWALPLVHDHHMNQHQWGNELEWWLHHGVDNPFALCIEYYERYKKETT